MSKRKDADENAPGYYCREELPPHLKDHTFFRGYPSRAEVDAFVETTLTELFPNGLQAMPREEREQATEVKHSGDMREHARAFAAAMLAIVTPADRVALAAPPKSRCNNKVGFSSSGFDARRPEWSARHAPFREVSRDFTGVAAKLGLSAMSATNIRAEVLLIQLANGELPQCPLDGRTKQTKPFEAELCAAFRPLWLAHEKALVEAEERGMVRDPNTAPTELKSEKAALLADLFSHMTLVKRGGTAPDIRRLLRVFSKVIDAARDALNEVAP